MSEQQRIECPAKLVDRLHPVQEQIDRLNAEINAALFGARLALGVADDWTWDGTGWTRPTEAKQHE